MKKFLALALVFVLALGLLAGCGEAKQEPEGGDEAVNVCVVVSSTFGDRSFNDSAKEGADKLAADYENITISTIECNNENFDAQMQNAADTANIVVCVGWEFYNVETIALDYPDVYWIWVDNATGAPMKPPLRIIRRASSTLLKQENGLLRQT